ncbi:MAG TPA: response regulator, partial [Bryobacteraceae bacterium]|nr:response regulator [Bryobacteraceae bacterium]
HPPRLFTIVLVEDNPADVRLVRTALEEHGVVGELIVFRDGENAICFIEHFDVSTPCPDLLIVDLNLPKRPGREVLECRGRGTLRAVPVVVLSSSDAAQDRADADRLGVDLYVKKPTRLDDFLRVGAVFREMLGLPPD